LRKIIKVVAENISKANQYTKDEEEQIEYAMKIVIFEALKTIGVIGILSALGYPIQTIIALATMIISKPFIGGYHEDSQIRCFLATLITIGSIVFLSINISLGLASKIILNLVALYCIWQQAPIVNSKMPITKQELIDKNRTSGTIIIIVLSIISITTNSIAIISNPITWTVIFQALLMFNKRNV
jgi:accessory gene regulator B